MICNFSVFIVSFIGFLVLTIILLYIDMETDWFPEFTTSYNVIGFLLDVNNPWCWTIILMYFSQRQQSKFTVTKRKSVCYKMHNVGEEK